MQTSREEFVTITLIKQAVPQLLQLSWGMITSVIQVVTVILFHGNDPLAVDGAGCGPLNTCCSFNNPPWFYKKVGPSSDYI